MGQYLEVIRNAFYFFPFVAFLFTIPYILHQYHKYGSIYYVRVLIVYSFILYLITAYFLVILPFPSFEAVVQLTTARVQLIPFSFVGDFIRETSFQITDVHTYLKAFLEPCVYIVVYNVFLTVPFGFYLHYYFRYNFKKSICYTFLLSVFFELTQLTGLYFIYPRGYRLFDVDDLILNTLGGAFGYGLASFGMHFLPSRDELDEKSFSLGKKISFLKRITCFCLDIFLFLVVFGILSIFIKRDYFLFLFWSVYYIFVPFLFGGSTIAQKFLNLKRISTASLSLQFYQIVLNQGLFLFLYILIPFWAIRYGNILFIRFSISSTFVVSFYVLGLFAYFLVCFFSFIAILRKKKLFYEKISKTELVSTI